MYYALVKLLTEPRVVQQIRAGGGSKTVRSLSELGIKDHDLLDGLLDDDHTQYILHDGTRAFTGDVDFGNNRLTNISTIDDNLHPDANNTYNAGYAGGAWLNGRFTNLYTGIIYSVYTTAYLYARDIANGTIRFVTQWGGGQRCAELVSLGAGNGVFRIQRAGDITMLATKSVDAYTNAGYMKTRRLSQSAEPTPEEGELLLWRDTDDDKTYLVYEDVDLGGRKIELT